MGALTTGQMSYILDEVVSAVLINEFAQLPNIFGSVYNIKTSSKARERSSSVGGLGQFSEKVELQSPDEEGVTQQYQKTFNHTPFAKTVAVSRELVDDEEWSWFQGLGEQLSMAASRTMETQAAGLFNDAFAGATYTGADGAALCADAHTNVDGGNSQDNKGTSAISNASIKAARTAMRKFTDYEGEKIAVTPNTLIVPTDLEQDAWEQINSMGKPGTANNDANFNQNRWQLIVWDYLTDDDNWFMVDMMLARLHLLWYMRSGLELYGDGDLFAGKRRIGAYFRKSNGFVDWRWCYGNDV